LIPQYLLWVLYPKKSPSQREEVAHLFLDAGHIVVSTTNSIGLADLSTVHSLIPDYQIFTINIDPSDSTMEPSDIQLTGKEEEKDVIEKISRLLEKKTNYFSVKDPAPPPRSQTELPFLYPIQDTMR